MFETCEPKLPHGWHLSYSNSRSMPRGWHPDKHCKPHMQVRMICSERPRHSGPKGFAGTYLLPNQMWPGRTRWRGSNIASSGNAKAQQTAIWLRVTEDIRRLYDPIHFRRIKKKKKRLDVLCIRTRVQNGSLTSFFWLMLFCLATFQSSKISTGNNTSQLIHPVQLFSEVLTLWSHTSVWPELLPCSWSGWFLGCLVNNGQNMLKPKQAWSLQIDNDFP